MNDVYSVKELSKDRSSSYVKALLLCIDDIVHNYYRCVLFVSRSDSGTALAWANQLYQPQPKRARRPYIIRLGQRNPRIILFQSPSGAPYKAASGCQLKPRLRGVGRGNNTVAMQNFNRSYFGRFKSNGHGTWPTTLLPAPLRMLTSMTIFGLSRDQNKK